MAGIFALFPRLGERLAQNAGTLSGGEQQMLAMARALMARPTLLLLDEPSLGLAPKLVRAIFDTIRAINQRGTTLLVVEQNAHMALATADRAYVLETGKSRALRRGEGAGARPPRTAGLPRRRRLNEVFQLAIAVGAVALRMSHRSARAAFPSVRALSRVRVRFSRQV